MQPNHLATRVDLTVPDASALVPLEQSGRKAERADEEVVCGLDVAIDEQRDDVRQILHQRLSITGRPTARGTRPPALDSLRDAIEDQA
jgi:hypothetical protein